MPTRACTVKDCERLVLAKSYCGLHYKRNQIHGNPLIVNPSPTRFKKNSVPWNKGLKGIHLSPKSEYKKGFMSNENHPQWKGERPGYFAVHYWIYRHWDKPKKCEHCGITSAKRYEWANVSKEYKRIREDWLILCKSCHNKYDDIGAKSWTTRRGSK